MIVLDATTKKLQVQQGAATASTAIIVSYADVTTTTCTPGTQVTAITTSAAVTDVCAAPTASTQRLIKQITISSNAVANFNEVTVLYDNNGTDYILWHGFLPPNGSVHYTSGTGWNMLDDKLALIQTPGFVQWGHPIGGGFMDDGGSATTNAAGTLSGTYQGVAQTFSKQAKCYYRITTAGVGPTYGEMSIWKTNNMSFNNSGQAAIDTPVGSGSQMLTRCGYVSTTAENVSVGQKEVTINLTVPIYPGELYYALLADAYTTTIPLYAAYLSNTLNCGSAVYTTLVQPSLATSPQLFSEIVSSTAPILIYTILQ